MPYIGRGLGPQGAFRILDDISGSFNGSTVTFALTVASAALTVGLPETLIIAVDGVIQEAGSAYTISGSNIVFGSAPQDAATFWGVELGDVGGIAKSIADGTITTDSLASGVLDTNISSVSGSDDTLASAKAIKTYVDAQVDTEDTLAEMGDVNLTSPGDAAVLIYDTATSTWRDAAVSGDATIGDTGAVTVASSHSGSAHHADAHTVASHSDTSITGAELTQLSGISANVTDTNLNILTDSSSTTALHAHAATGAIVREGGNTSEATTTSTSEDDLMAAASLTIAATQPFMAIAVVRKTSGAASRAELHLALNSANSNGTHVFSTTNQAEAQTVKWEYGARVTNYTGHGYQFASDTIPNSVGKYAINSVAMPTVEVTSVKIRGRSINAAVTYGQDELHVYSLAVS